MLLLERKSWWRLLIMVRGAPLGRIWQRLAAVLLVSIVIEVIHWQTGLFERGLTTTPFTLIGFALGIFLGFRNNTSYDRFWEGRKLWGALVNTSRTAARQVATLVGPVDASAAGPAELRAIHTELVHRLIAYVHCFRHHLRNEAHPGDAASLLSDREASALVGRSNPPQELLLTQGRRYRELWQQGLIHPMHLPTLEAHLTELTSIQGACERIKSTPIPASYTILIHRLVATYVFALPFGLVGTLGAVSPIVVMLVAYAFLGLDTIGDEIEEPFGSDVNDLPLSTLSRMIEVNLRELNGETEVPELLRPQGGLLS